MHSQSENFVFLFPGQGSQSVGMGQALAHSFSVAEETFTQADEVLGIPLTKIAWEGPEEELDDTINTQPALLAHSVAALRVLDVLHPGIKPHFLAGHSMGELSALVAAGSLPYREALLLVRTRGKVMKAAGEAIPGGMAAIIGLDIQTMENICAKVSSKSDPVQVANDNCPGQVVISGTRPALKITMRMTREAGARRVFPLKVSIASHSVLMNKTQDEFNRAVELDLIIDPIVPIVGNVSARPLESAQDVCTDLQEQLISRVRWTESIQYMLTQGATTFLEIGSGSVLSGLLKRIDRKAAGIPLGLPEDFELFQNS